MGRRFATVAFMVALGLLLCFDVSGGAAPVQAGEIATTPEPTLTPRAYLPFVARNFPPPEVVITWPTEGERVSTTSNCIVTVRGTVDRAPAGSYLLFWVHTNTRYLQVPIVPATVPAGTWQAWPIYLAGQGIFNDHWIVAELYSPDGMLLAEGEVTGVVRINPCWTP